MANNTTYVVIAKQTYSTITSRFWILSPIRVICVSTLNVSCWYVFLVQYTFRTSSIHTLVQHRSLSLSLHANLSVFISADLETCLYWGTYTIHLFFLALSCNALRRSPPRAKAHCIQSYLIFEYSRFRLLTETVFETLVEGFVSYVQCIVRIVNDWIYFASMTSTVVTPRDRDTTSNR